MKENLAECAVKSILTYIISDRLSTLAAILFCIIYLIVHVLDKERGKYGTRLLDAPFHETGITSTYLFFLLRSGSPQPRRPRGLSAARPKTQQLRETQFNCHVKTMWNGIDVIWLGAPSVPLLPKVYQLYKVSQNPERYFTHSSFDQSSRWIST